MSAEDDESLELPVKLSDIERAHTDIKDAVICTDMDLSRTLSSKLSAEVWLKFENLQFTASFKERGALNKLLSLTQKERQAGVIAM